MKYSFKFHKIIRVGAGIVECLQDFMEIDLELTEKSAKNTQRWWKLTATIDMISKLWNNLYLLFYRAILLSNQAASVINRMRIYVLCIIITLYVPVFNKYLTGTAHKNYQHVQRKLLLNDVFVCSEQRKLSLRENLQHLYQCLRRHIIHCDNRHRKSLDFIQLAQDKTKTYCTSIVLQGVDINHQPKTIYIQIMNNFMIQFSFIMFDFEYFSQVYHGLFISENVSDDGRNTTYYTGRRLPWTMITTSNTAVMTISTFSNLKFRLNSFYSAYKRNWLSHIQHVQSNYLGRSTRDGVVHINLLESLKLSNNNNLSFSYHYIQEDWQGIIVSYDSIVESKIRIAVYDGPGRLSTRLLQSKTHNFYENVTINTSTFHVYLEIYILSLQLGDLLYVSVRSNYIQYRQCDKNMIFLQRMVYFSLNTTNTMCVIPFDNVAESQGMLYPIYIEQYSFDGPVSIMTGYGHLKCQYGGVFFTYNQNKALCKTGRRITVFNDVGRGHILVVWLMGYSKGYIIARHLPDPCFYHHISDLRQPTKPNRIEFCQSYICPQPVSTKQQQCNMEFKIPGRSTVTAEIGLYVFNSIDDCVPGFGVSSDTTMYNFSALYYTHTRLGIIKKLSVSKKIFGPAFGQAFQYLVSGYISLPVFCKRRRQNAKMAVRLRIATCRNNRQNFINNINVIEEGCLPVQLPISPSNLLIYHEKYARNYSRHLFLTAYDSKCHHSCRNYTFILKVYRKFQDRVDMYSAEIGETVSTGFNHQGFWIKVIGQRKACPFGKCDVWVSIAERYLEKHDIKTSRLKYFDTARWVFVI